MMTCREPCDQEECPGVCDRVEGHPGIHKGEGCPHQWGVRVERHTKKSTNTKVAGIIKNTEPEVRTGPPITSPMHHFVRSNDPPNSWQAIREYHESQPEKTRAVLRYMLDHLGEWITTATLRTHSVVGGGQDGDRRMRDLRQLGWNIETRHYEGNIWQHRLVDPVWRRDLIKTNDEPNDEPGEVIY